MRAFIIIPVPLLLLIATVFSGVTEKEPVLSIPPDIETFSVEEQIKFGDKAMNFERYDLAIKYCAAGENAEDLMLRVNALLCMKWSSKLSGDIDGALKYAELMKVLKQNEGWDTKTTDAEIADLKKMR